MVGVRGGWVKRKVSIVQILHEQVIEWPVSGPVQIEAPALTVEVAVAPDFARRRANGYLGSEAAMSMLAHNPRLVVDGQPLWRFDIDLCLPVLGYIATLGAIDVDAMTGAVVPLTSTQLTSLQERADALAARFTPVRSVGRQRSVPTLA